MFRQIKSQMMLIGREFFGEIHLRDAIKGISPSPVTHAGSCAISNFQQRHLEATHLRSEGIASHVASKATICNFYVGVIFLGGAGSEGLQLVMRQYKQ
ncbi:hypothetical protein AVEN_98409-1 [Araneus ventricosus]|uniref:Uncharacterized protein n=1 Tax=Araneus ventricosus TaxID=182803 RepID=A0A4Y2JYM0_ARAVE|nr:hypothetical protein AVEN_98409-1 [Araneus ventricosus]